LRTLTLCAIALVAALPTLSSAQTPAVAQSGSMPRDAKIDLITSDLHALSRIATLSKDINDSRQVMLAIIDSDLETLREKRPDDTYRWASLQREEASRVKNEKALERVQSEAKLDEVTVTAPNAYRLEVTVPKKRNLVSANNRVYVRNVIVDSTGYDGKTSHHEIPVNAWISPGDSNGVALPEIGKSVKAVAELGVESGEKRAVAEVALVQARLVDDPTSPYYPAVRRLLQIRDAVKEKEINRGPLKNTIDEALLAMPGELEKRTAEMAAAEARRKQLAESGQLANAITVGDATPDVTAALQAIGKLMVGTLDDQAAARTKLQSLIDSLTPKPAMK
jgi:hypothetical protein